MTDYHVPVLLDESIDALRIVPDGVYIDVTYGGGGHAKKIIEKLSDKGRLIVFDQDGDAKDNVINDKRLIFVKSNFRYLYRYWRWLDVGRVDGVLADLGVSSHQIDDAERGFSHRYEADLDMRMNEDMPLTAKKILATYGYDELLRIFSKYGEIKNSKTLASSIIDKRMAHQNIGSSVEFNALVGAVFVGDRSRYLSQVYQALRIEVNDELGALEDLLIAGLSVLKVGGRMVFISYHSLEDRMVKRFFKTGEISGKERKDEYGRSLSKIKSEKKLILPSEEEVRRNTRSRSAKMRIGVKIAE